MAESAEQPEPTPRPSEAPVKTRDDAPATEGSLDPASLGAAAPTSGEIRDVDFYNDFVYPVTFGEEIAITVADGEYVDERVG